MNDRPVQVSLLSASEVECLVDLLETLLILLAAVILMGLVMGLVLRTALRGRSSADNLRDSAATTELGTLKAANAELGRRLAVEEFRASRLADVEATSAELITRLEVFRDSRSKIESELASAHQATTGLERVEVDLRERLASSKAAFFAIETETTNLRDAKGAVDEALATQTATLVAADTSVRELKSRLTAEGEKLHNTEERFAKLRDEKATVDETLSARVAALDAAGVNILDYKQRLGIAEDCLKDWEARFLELRDEKATGDESLSARTESLKNSNEVVEQLRGQAVSVTSSLVAAQEAVSQLKAANATIQETLDQEGKQADAKIALLMSARAEMGKEFKVLAEEVMLRHGESFTKLNREQMDGILTPLKEKLGEFERNVHTSHVESVKERATLAEQIRHIAETGAAMGKETRELTEALRGKSQTQGAWGEMVLGTILERSGLRPGQEYSVQKSFSNDDGSRLRPDVVINLPGGQHMVVDAKVSLTAFENLVNAATDEERAGHLERHLASVRGHISNLSSKDYHLVTGTTLDYVVMFVPIEGALAAALHADPSLICYAAERNVAITTPSTLMIALRTVANVWTVERRNQNAEEIAVRAGKLYDKFVGFITDMNAVGESITRSRSAFDGAMNKMVTGKGNVVRQLEQLKSMGGRTSKSLPASLLEAAEGDVTLEATTQVVETETIIEITI